MHRFHSVARISGAIVTLLAAVLPAAALDILVSNDDGYDALGIRSLADALRKDGHNVTIVGPSEDRSGSSAALTFTSFKVTRISDDVWSVATTPGTTVMFGVWMLKETGDAPDLIVSGINWGSNLGPTTLISGTLGNTVAAMTQLNSPIPAIAFSTNPIDGNEKSEANKEHFSRVADFAVKVVRKLSKDDEVVGLEPGYAININYPTLPPDRVKGVRFAVEGEALNFTNEFKRNRDGTYVSSGDPLNVEKDVANSDTVLFQEGYITIVPLRADYTAPRSMEENLKPFLGDLTPNRCRQ